MLSEHDDTADTLGHARAESAGGRGGLGGITIELIKRADQWNRGPAYWRAFLAASLSSSAGGSGRYGKAACTAGQLVDPQAALDTLAWTTRNRGVP